MPNAMMSIGFSGFSAAVRLSLRVRVFQQPPPQLMIGRRSFDSFVPTSITIKLVLMRSIVLVDDRSLPSPIHRSRAIQALQQQYWCEREGALAEIKAANEAEGVQR
ncbi:hypothetical protein U1Q18_030998 [Sarracenia purpurea var. burkii]